MRLFLAFLLIVVVSSSAPAQTANADRQYPAIWVPLLRALTKPEVDKLQSSANAYCKGLNYAVVGELYKDVGGCTLMQSSAIQDLDVSLSDLKDQPATQFRPAQVKKCWAIYRALGAGDVENLANCFGHIEYFELLQRVVAEHTPAPSATISSYCRRVADASGGSYVILEGCQKEEQAARRRLGE